MPAIGDLHHQFMTIAESDTVYERVASSRYQYVEFFTDLVKRINIPVTYLNSTELIDASDEDPWLQAGKYSLGWVWFSLLALGIAALLSVYRHYTDSARLVLHKEAWNDQRHLTGDHAMTLRSRGYTVESFSGPPNQAKNDELVLESSLNMPFLNKIIAGFRWVVYRPPPSVSIGRFSISLPALSATGVVLIAFIFVTLYCFIPQPLYYPHISDGSPPLAIRAGMISVAMIPWIVVLSMKANLISFATGIGHERLNVLHRWAGYICLFLALIHTIPFYVTPVWADGALAIFKSQNYFWQTPYVYGSGLAALAPLAFLCVHSLPFIRAKAYELFVLVHAPVSVVFIGMMFWHCSNALTSWNYLWATVGIWAFSLLIRLVFVNWTRFWWGNPLHGEEAAITILHENAIKVTIPTRMRWQPGQFVYLRIPAISFHDSHPFTIASLCDRDLPSEYGQEYRDMVIVLRPFGGFTRRLMHAAVKNGPDHTYRTFIDGPYGGIRRQLVAFDTVVLIAGGSGITAIVSQLLRLVKKMRDNTAVTKKVYVFWAMKRPETAEWFKEELLICRRFAPKGSIQFQFYITAAKRPDVEGDARRSMSRPVSEVLHDKVTDAFQGVSSKRNSVMSMVSQKAPKEIEHDYKHDYDHDYDRDRKISRENEDKITPLPLPMPRARLPPPKLSLHIPSQSPNHRPPPEIAVSLPSPEEVQAFNFGFPSTPSMFQKSLMRFAFMPPPKPKSEWETEYGRPDIPFLLRSLGKDFGKRTAVFVCGPSDMRTDVQRVVAGLQRGVMKGEREEVFLWTENYAL